MVNLEGLKFQNDFSLFFSFSFLWIRYPQCELNIHEMCNIWHHVNLLRCHNSTTKVLSHKFYGSILHTHVRTYISVIFKCFGCGYVVFVASNSNLERITELISLWLKWYFIKLKAGSFYYDKLWRPYELPP